MMLNRSFVAVPAGIRALVRTRRPVTLLFMMLMCISLQLGLTGVAFAGRFGPPWQSQVVVEQSTLYTQPDKNSAVVGPLPRAAIVVVVGQTKGADGSDWTQIPDGYLPSGDVKEYFDEWVAEVTAPSVSVYAKPNPSQGIRRTAQRGDLLRVTGVVHGLDGDPALWWATTEGYVDLHSLGATTNPYAASWVLPSAGEAPGGWWGAIRSQANVRAAPTTDAPVVGSLVGGNAVKVLSQKDGQSVGGNPSWDRIDGGRYAGAWVHSSLIVKSQDPVSNTTPPADMTGVSSWITVDRAANSLTFVRGGQAVFTTFVSLGDAGVQTPDGNYTTFGKFVGDEMTSSSVSDATHSYDLPNVPFVQYYKDGGYAIHATYWHDLFGTTQSQGCINVTWTDGSWLFTQTQPTLPPDQVFLYAGKNATPVVIVN